jgi:uncharacterized protein YeeX (DUF496 family)
MAPSKTTRTRAQLDICEGLERKQAKQREYSAKSRDNKQAMSSTNNPTDYITVIEMSIRSIQWVINKIYNEYFVNLYVVV